MIYVKIKIIQKVTRGVYNAYYASKLEILFKISFTIIW